MKYFYEFLSNISYFYENRAFVYSSQINALKCNGDISAPFTPTSTTNVNDFQKSQNAQTYLLLRETRINLKFHVSYLPYKFPKLVYVDIIIPVEKQIILCRKFVEYNDFDIVPFTLIFWIFLVIVSKFDAWRIYCWWIQCPNAWNRGEKSRAETIANFTLLDYENETCTTTQTFFQSHKIEQSDSHIIYRSFPLDNALNELWGSLRWRTTKSTSSELLSSKDENSLSTSIDEFKMSVSSMTLDPSTSRAANKQGLIKVSVPKIKKGFFLNLFQ